MFCFVAVCYEYYVCLMLVMIGGVLRFEMMIVEDVGCVVWSVWCRVCCYLLFVCDFCVVLYFK